MPTNTRRQIPRFQKDQLIDADRMNQIVDYINEMRLSATAPLTQQTGPGGTILGLGRLDFGRHFKVTTQITAASSTVAGQGLATAMYFDPVAGTWSASTNGTGITIYSNVKVKIIVNSLIICLNVDGLWWYVVTDCANGA